MTISANTMDSLMLPEKCSGCRVGRKRKVLFYALQKGLIQTAKCFHSENLMVLLMEQQLSDFMPLLCLSPVDFMG